MTCPNYVIQVIVYPPLHPPRYRVYRIYVLRKMLVVIDGDFGLLRAKRENQTDSIMLAGSPGTDRSLGDNGAVRGVTERLKKSSGEVGRKLKIPKVLFFILILL